MVYAIIILSGIIFLVNAKRLQWKGLSVSLRELINKQIKEINRLKNK